MPVQQRLGGCWSFHRKGYPGRSAVPLHNYAELTQRHPIFPELREAREAFVSPKYAEIGGLLLVRGHG